MFTMYASGSRCTNTMGVNAIRNREAMRDVLELTGQQAEPLLGCFDGIPEHSFRVQLRTSQISPVTRLMFEKFQQDAVLVISRVGEASLVWHDGSVEDVGKLTPSDTMPTGDWSFDGRQFWQVS